MYKEIQSGCDVSYQKGAAEMLSVYPVTPFPIDSQHCMVNTLLLPLLQLLRASNDVLLHVGK